MFFDDADQSLYSLRSTQNRINLDEFHCFYKFSTLIHFQLRVRVVNLVVPDNNRMTIPYKMKRMFTPSISKVDTFDSQIL